MSAPKFTPGPWRWSDTPHGSGRLLDANDSPVASGVGLVSNYGCRIDEFIEVWENSDKRLIAAAPEMYALLRRAKPFLRRVFEQNPARIGVEAGDLEDELDLLLRRIDGE